MIIKTPESKKSLSVNKSNLFLLIFLFAFFGFILFLLIDSKENNQEIQDRRKQNQIECEQKGWIVQLDSDNNYIGCLSK